MNKLISIVLRWMKKDRKRTLLSFLSIMLAMYMMTFLGIYFSAGVSMMRSLESYENGSYHACVTCRDLSQAKDVVSNVSVEKGAVSTAVMMPFERRFIEEYKDKNKGGDENYLPVIEINGKPAGELDASKDVGLISGELDELERNGRSPILTGRVPQKDGEVVISAKLANKLGVNVGDTLTVRTGARKAKVEYMLYEPISSEELDRIGIELRDKQYGDEASWHEMPPVEERMKAYNGGKEPELVTDTTGEGLNTFYSSFLTAPDNGMVNFRIYCELYSTLAAAANPEGDMTFYSWTDETHEDTVGCIGLRLTPTDEIADVKELSFTVVGTESTGCWHELNFYAFDKDISPFADSEDCQAYIRIKEGLDIDTEIRRLQDTADIHDDTSTGRSFINLNTELIFLEGRGFEYANDVLMLFVVMLIILAVFIFFARLIVNNAFELSSAYRAEQYGALKTIGASNRQIFMMVMIECFIYILTALPISVLLAVISGKAVMSHITDLKIFDLKYGSGVSDTFFQLKIIPTLLIVIVAVSVFSVVMSAYACAIRIRKLAPIDSLSKGRGKAFKPRKHKPLSVKHLRFPLRYALRSNGKNATGLGLMLLSTFISGVLVISVVTLVRTFDFEVKQFEEESNSDDFYISQLGNYAVPGQDNGNPARDLIAVDNSGYFQRIFSQSAAAYHSAQSSDVYDYDAETTVSSSDKSNINDSFVDQISEEFAEVNEATGKPRFFLVLRPIVRSEYEKLRADITYDELVASKGVLISGTESSHTVSDGPSGREEAVNILNAAYLKEISYDDVRFVPSEEGGENSVCAMTDSVRIFKQLPKELTLPKDSADPDSETFTLSVAGIYTTDMMSLANISGTLTAAIPAETLADLIDSDKSKKLVEDLYPWGLEMSLQSKDGMHDEAAEWLMSRYPDDGCVHDYTINTRTNEKLSQALRFAGYSMAVMIFAVALINIVSSSAATILNRRRELSVLRSCGMPLRDVFKALTYEALFCALISAAFSSVAAYVLCSFLTAGKNIVIKYSFLSAIAVFLFILASILIPYLLPLRSMRDSAIAEEIRSKE